MAQFRLPVASMIKAEFSIVSAPRFNVAGPVRWILSHALRYPLFPLAMILAAIGNNTAFSYVQVFVGRAFDVITTPGWSTAALAAVALSVLAAALSQGVTGLVRNYAAEFLAQRSSATHATSCTSACSARARPSTAASASATSWRGPPTTCGH